MIRTTARWTVPFLFAALVTGCAQPPRESRSQDDPAATSAMLDSLNRAFVAAVAARDTQAVASFYSDDAHVLAPGAPRADGREAIRALWAQFLSTPGLELSLTAGPPVISEAGDLVIDLGTYRMRSTGAGGAPVEDVGKYVTVLKQVNGEWKIFVDIFNTDSMPPGA